ncbi:MAG: TlpA disulfide reductase family protein [Pseudomonadota bacterium]
MSRFQSFLLILAVSALAGAGGFGVQRWLSSDEPAPAGALTPTSVIGQPLPDFALISLAGDTLSRERFAGRPLIVNLWATWCEPCRKEMPDLSLLAEELAPEGLQVLGIALDQPGRVAEFLADTPVVYPIAITETAEGMRLARDMGNRQGVLPYTLFVDAAGVIRQVKVGVMEESEIRRRAAALSEASG